MLLTPHTCDIEKGKILEEGILKEFENIMETAKSQPPIEITPESIQRVIKTFKRKKAPDRELEKRNVARRRTGNT